LDIIFAACESTLSKRGVGKKVAVAVKAVGNLTPIRRIIACAAGGRGDPCTQ
jgi:hypothetical protein